MSTTGQEPSEEELRAAYEEEIRKIRVEHVVLEQIVTLVNLGMRRTGLAPGTEAERDRGQVQLAIDSIRALLPVVEGIAPEQLPPIRQALSQLQLAYVRIGEDDQATAESGAGPGEAGSSPAAGPVADPGETASGPGGSPPGSGPPAGEGGGAGPAQRSGRLWIPGQ
ncbi:MAG: hypothetical protein ACYC91_00295 [Solirubrobacteraceae bacterium]